MKWNERLDVFSTKPDFVKSLVLGTLSTPTRTLRGTFVAVFISVI